LKFFYWSKVFSSEGRVGGEEGSPKIHSKMLGSGRNYKLFDAESQGEQLMGEARLTKISL